jgi:mannitol-1-phosphate 5-dehydrogenase
VHVVACENMKEGSTVLAGHVRSLLGSGDAAYAERVVSFPDCMINRVVPAPVDPLRLETEDYCEWTIESDAVRGPWPPGAGFIERVRNQAARLDRKLFVYNGSHAATAYFGHQRGLQWIHEAVADPDVARRVGGVLQEMAAVVQHHHGFSPKAMERYKRDFWLRCRNAGLRDPIPRVARQPKRKLGRQERFIAPAQLAVAHALPRACIVDAVVAALCYRYADDEQTGELERELSREGIRETLRRVCGLEPGDALSREIERRWREQTGTPRGDAND